jgi:hypothetical protein
MSDSVAGNLDDLLSTAARFYEINVFHSYQAISLENDDERGRILWQFSLDAWTLDKLRESNAASTFF